MFEIFVGFALVYELMVWFILMEEGPEVYVVDFATLDLVLQFVEVLFDPIFLNWWGSIEGIEGNVLLQ